MTRFSRRARMVQTRDTFRYQVFWWAPRRSPSPRQLRLDVLWAAYSHAGHLPEAYPFYPHVPER